MPPKARFNLHSGASASVDLHVGEPAEDDGHVLAEVEHVDAAHLLGGAAGLALRLQLSGSMSRNLFELYSAV